MELGTVAGLISGGGQFLGGLGGLLGGGGLSPRKAAALEYEYAQTMAQNAIQWRVQDAEKAGIHPLFALGANISVPSPSVVGDTGSSRGSRLQEMGQGISRAAGAYMDGKARQILLDQELRKNELEIKNAEITVQKNASDLALSRAAATVPIASAHMIPGQGQVAVVPSRQTTSMIDNRGIEAGAPPGTQAFVMPDGHTIMLPSAQAAEAMEDNIPYQIEHYLRNRVVAPLVWGARQLTSPRHAPRGGTRPWYGK